MHDRVERVVGRVLKRTLSLERDGAAPLRDLGLASLRMIQLIGELEQEFDLRIEDDEVDPENFDTLAALCAFVERKQGDQK